MTAKMATKKPAKANGPGKPGPKPPAQSVDKDGATLARGLCLAGGVETTDEFDVDGIPKWQRHPEYGYHHAGRYQMIFAIRCQFFGFNLPEFDVWLSAMEPCGAKQELIERRRLAWEAVSKNTPDDSILRHLEWMLLRWRFIRREEYILPLARTGDRHKKASIRGARNKEAPKWHLDCVEGARKMIATGMEPRNVSSKLASRLGKHRRTVDRILKKAGIK